MSPSGTSPHSNANGAAGYSDNGQHNTSGERQHQQRNTEYSTPQSHTSDNSHDRVANTGGEDTTYWDERREHTGYSRNDTESPEYAENEQSFRVQGGVDSYEHIDPDSAYRVEENQMQFLEEAFKKFDSSGNGRVPTFDLPALLESIGRNPSDADNMLKDFDPDRTKSMTFQQFVDLLNVGRPPLPDDSPDPKIYEFIRVLEEYRVKCEDEGNYLEAGRAAKQLAVLRKQEERRQNKALRARQLAERQDVQIAHNMQFAEFNSAWDRYIAEYDQMAQMYIKQMTEKHTQKLKEFQQALHTELISKPPRFSRELLDWRKRQTLLAKQRKYAEAQKIKRIADELEKRERMKMDEHRLKVFQQREQKFRQQQKQELASLLKRIDVRRREHLKQRENDTKRLLQRNKNVQQVLETKQSMELNKRRQEIKLSLAPKQHTMQRESNRSPGATSVSRSRSASPQKGLTTGSTSPSR
eukprot:gb/GECG01004366.1/.p1 GENE.gb/GECG01004366.1/~~gb/GECG01004366.1/.p1  ORF type:complete len:469 (+),score=86.24 gb/GECG01004366.1/:1-1407(+)